MSNRFPAVCLAWAVCLLGGFLSRAAADSHALSAEEHSTEAAPGKLIQKVYPVADLIVSPGRSLAGVAADRKMEKEHARPGGPVVSEWTGSRRAGQRRTLQTRLIELITGTIQPGTWDCHGGPGSITYYPLGMALVVNQTPDVQEQVADLLASLRRLQDVEVAVEVRFLTVPDSFFERLGPDLAIHFPGAASRSPAPDPSTDSAGWSAFLDDRQLHSLMEAVQGEQRANVMQAPKVTVANGSSATVELSDQEFFVTGVDIAREDGQVVLRPRNEPLWTGLRLSVRPAVSADRESVRLRLEFRQTRQMEPAVPLMPITVTLPPKPGAGSEPVPCTQFLQQPRLNTQALRTTLNIPDGGTVVLGGWRTDHSVRWETPAPPVLSRVPYLNRLFKNVGYGREAENLVLLVTPRIIIQEEEQELRSVPAARR